MSGVDEATVADAVIALLRDQMPDGVLVGDGGAPYVDTGTEPVATVDPAVGEAYPYLAVYVIPPMTAYEGWVGQAGAETVRFQLTGAGPAAAAARSCAVVAAGILCDRDDTDPADRGYVHDLTIPGHGVMWRKKTGRGHPDSEGGWYNHSILVDVGVHRTA